MTYSGAELAALLAEAGIEPSRSLGQNFVVDPNTVRRIVRLAGVGPGERVVEVGAGLGSLTRALLDAGAEVTAVEIDRRLTPILRRRLEPEGVRVVEADALRVDWPALLGEGGPPWRLVANLPYNVGVPIVLTVLEQAPMVHDLVVMLQREVAERLAARPGQKAYGAPSVKAAYWADAALLGTVPPSVFLPRPHVESALVHLVRRAPPPPADRVERGWLFALVEAGFGQRRKMLRRSLAGLATDAQLLAAGVDPTDRAERLDLGAWARLAEAAAAGRGNPAPPPGRVGRR
ncbi:MAG: 16S rRNA (adenine(1518)-N(6)/adenine(1519)-N(6))-dimethyltransferase RsmA [Acidimicrobiales bacterium]